MTRKPKQSTQSSSRLKLSGFAQALRREWKRLGLAQKDETVLVAVSGGADSVALLLALNELVTSGKLKANVVVAHLDHKLRGPASRADAVWVAKLAQQLRHKFAVTSIDVKKRAAKTGDNLEQAARQVRYEFLSKTAKKLGAVTVLTAHTMDDQAETILLNLLRGSGADGLRGMEPARSLAEGSETILVRPLLQWARRQDTVHYCGLRGVEFRNDEMNLDENFTRVRVRRQLLPLMESFNPKIVRGLARTAELLREDGIALDGAAARLLELAAQSVNAAPDDKGGPPALRIDLLTLAHPALRRRALRRWLTQFRGDLKRVERAHIQAVESLLFGNHGGRTVELPGGSKVSRKSGFIRFHA
jgi:tRNA(Ile)-lysidine synthase